MSICIFPHDEEEEVKSNDGRIEGTVRSLSQYFVPRASGNSPILMPEFDPSTEQLANILSISTTTKIAR